MKLAWGLTFSIAKIQIMILVVKVEHVISIEDHGNKDHDDHDDHDDLEDYEDHDDLEVHDCRPVQGVP